MKEASHCIDEYLMLYHKLVIRNVYDVTKDYYIAEDISQETFIRLSEELDRIAPEKVKGWLLCVSKRRALDYLKKGGKHEILPGIEEFCEEFTVDDYADLSEMMVHKEEIECKGNVVLKLKKERPLWYDVLLMSSVEEMDNHSIGKVLGVKKNLVSQWKGRARDFLWKIYAEDSEE